MVTVEFLGGPADGAVGQCWISDVVIHHPEWPDAEYVVFKRVADGRRVARYAQPG